MLYLSPRSHTTEKIRVPPQTSNHLYHGISEKKTIDTLRELVFLRRISGFLVGRNHSSQIGDINHNIQKFGSCLTMFNYTFHNRYYQYYIKRFWGYVFPGTKYTYLERKCPLVLMGKGLLLEGSTPKIEDKQVPGL